MKFSVNKIFTRLYYFLLKQRKLLILTLPDKNVIRMENPTSTTFFRYKTFFTKEPDTLAWLDTLTDSDVFFDVGANVGLYSLYAGISKNAEVYSFEPESQNFASLCRNINLNKVYKLIQPFCFAAHSSTTISSLFLSSFTTGNALSSFSRDVDFQGNSYEVSFCQGSVGLSLDDFSHLSGILPTFIKIDVDGNELFVVQGLQKLLARRTIKKLIVEVDELSPEYSATISLITKHGYQLAGKYRSPLSTNSSAFSRSYNHHFILS